MIAKHHDGNGDGMFAGPAAGDERYLANLLTAVRFREKALSAAPRMPNEQL
jgi:hypothetical protein